MSFASSLSPKEKTGSLSLSSTTGTSHLTVEEVKIDDALNILKTGVLALALCEYYQIKTTNIIGAVPDVAPIFYFDQDGFSKILSKDADILKLVIDTDARSAISLAPNADLKMLGSMNIFKRFPLLQTLLDPNNYPCTHQALQHTETLNHCKAMLGMWQHWSNEARFSHLISSLQSLSRLLAAKLKTPKVLDFESKIENGLSVEYQCEIYAEQLYGAKLLEIWHFYLMSSDTTTLKDPQLFLKWLALLSKSTLQEFGITDLKEVPRVVYMLTDEDRAKYRLEFRHGNVLENNALQKPKIPGEEIEIIYALGKNLPFYGAVKKRGVINHSSFFGGKKVDGAGRILVKATADESGKLQWVIHAMDDNSGHIKPNNNMNLSTLLKMQELGLDLTKIKWVSTWGTPGATDETAAMALKRLKNDSEDVVIAEEKLPEKSEFINKLREYSEKALLGSMYDLVFIHRNRVTAAESSAAAILILHGLKNYITKYTMTNAAPSIAKYLAAQALHFLRNVGKRSTEMEGELRALIQKYEVSYSLFTPKSRMVDVAMEMSNQNVTAGVKLFTI